MKEHYLQAWKRIIAPWNFRARGPRKQQSTHEWEGELIWRRKCCGCQGSWGPQALFHSCSSCMGRVFLQSWPSAWALLSFPFLLAFFHRRLDANHISYVPPSCFSGLHSLRHLWLDDNALTEIPVQAFRSLSALQAMTLALNKIHHIPDYAFGNLSSLVVL